MTPKRLAALFGLTLATGLLTVAVAQNVSTRKTPSFDGRPQVASATRRTALDAHRTLGAPKTYGNLTLIPVYDSKARAADIYTTLDEGLKAKTVTVTEVKSGGEVNTLRLSNTGNKPVYIMAGEVVLGGQQDRCLGRDTILPSGKKNVEITVFCVEHGRWTGKGEFDKSAPTLAIADIRASAQDGAFVAAGGKIADARADAVATANPVPPNAAAQAPNAALPTQQARQQAGVPIQRADGVVQTPASQTDQGRAVSRRMPRQALPSATANEAASVGDAQGKVWARVAKANGKFKAENATGTYQNVLTLQEGEAQKSVTPYIKALSSGFGSDPHLVGVVAAVNGKVVAADIFGDPTLFHKLWPKLIRSYAADAAENAPDRPSRDKKPAIITPSQAAHFYLQATDAKSKEEAKSELGTTLRFDSTAARTYRFLPVKKSAAAPGSASDEPAVHETVLKK